MCKNQINKISAPVSDLLNIIRIVAALCVIIGHGFSLFKIGPLQDDRYFPYIQSLAVLVFFILSGFLTDFSLHKGKYSYKSFMINRFKRIYLFFIPALLFVIILDSIWINLKSGSYPYYDNFNVLTAIKNILLIPRFRLLNGSPVWSIIYNEPIGSARPFWTLFIEWWLYILYGYIVLLNRGSKRARLKLILCFFASAVSLILFDNQSRCCLFCYALGVLINRFYRKIRINWFLSIALLFLSVFLFLGVSIWKKKTYCPEECCVVALLFLFLIILFNKVEYNKTNRVVKQFSLATYPLYLTHYSVMDFIKKFFLKIEDSKIQIIVGCLCSVIVCLIIMFVTKVIVFLFKRMVERV